jgi:molecular chaperone DnaJ
LGYIIKDLCETCHGSGLENKTINKTIKIPLGINDKNKIIFRSEGNECIDGQNGDLHIKFYIKKHEYFKREGYDLVAEIPISFTQAILGDEINITNIDNKIFKIKVPNNCQNGKILKIKNAGIPLLESPEHRGDLYIKTYIDIPETITKEERELLKKFKEIHEENSNPSFKKIES